MTLLKSTFSVPQHMALFRCPECSQPFAMTTALLAIKRAGPDTKKNICCPAGCVLWPFELDPQLANVERVPAALQITAR